MVETLYYCNLLCYLKCSTSLLTETTCSVMIACDTSCENVDGVGGAEYSVTPSGMLGSCDYAQDYCLSQAHDSSDSVQSH